MRLSPQDTELRKFQRREQILIAAARVAERGSYLTMTKAEIAAEAGMSASLVGFYFTPMADLRKALMAHAVMHRKYVIVAQGLAANDAIALDAPDPIRKRAIEHLGR